MRPGIGDPLDVVVESEGNEDEDDNGHGHGHSRGPDSTQSHERLSGHNQLPQQQRKTPISGDDASPLAATGTAASGSAGAGHATSASTGKPPLPRADSGHTRPTSLARAGSSNSAVDSLRGSGGPLPAYVIAGTALTDHTHYRRSSENDDAGEGAGGFGSPSSLLSRGMSTGSRFDGGSPDPPSQAMLSPLAPRGSASTGASGLIGQPRPSVTAVPSLLTAASLPVDAPRPDLIKDLSADVSADADLQARLNKMVNTAAGRTDALPSSDGAGATSGGRGSIRGTARAGGIAERGSVAGMRPVRVTSSSNYGTSSSNAGLTPSPGVSDGGWLQQPSASPGAPFSTSSSAATSRHSAASSLGSDLLHAPWPGASAGSPHSYPAAAVTDSTSTATVTVIGTGSATGASASDSTSLSVGGPPTAAAVSLAVGAVPPPHGPPAGQSVQSLLVGLLQQSSFGLRVYGDDTVIRGQTAEGGADDAAAPFEAPGMEALEAEYALFKQAFLTRLDPEDVRTQAGPAFIPGFAPLDTSAVAICRARAREALAEFTAAEETGAIPSAALVETPLPPLPELTEAATAVPVVALQRGIPRAFHAHTALGMHHYIRGRWGRARLHLLRAAEVYPDGDESQLPVVRFMAEHNFVAPPAWKGYRVLEL